MFRKGMDDLICSLHREIVKKDNQGERISRATEKIVADFLKDEKLERNNSGKDEFYSTIMLIASAIEENGFAMGFKYAFHLIMECMTNE